MAESATHAALVAAIVAYADRELGGFANVAVFEDAVLPIRGERPPTIDGYVPDVFARDVPTTVTLIGEAKTSHDLERDHSLRQIRAFLGYLSRVPSGVFVLCVPFVSVVTARSILADVSKINSSPTTRLVVLDGSGVITE